MPISSDPNETLQRIERNSTQTLHWVRFGMIFVIVLLVLVIVGL